LLLFKLMKYLLSLYVAFASASGSLSAASWLTDHGTATLRRAAENKPTLMLFTGSDWCPACQNLQSNVFSKPEFSSYADANLILLEIDFPKKRAVPIKERQARESLARSHRVASYPTMILLDTKGQEAIRINYGGATAKEFVTALDQYVRQITPGRMARAAAGSQPASGGTQPAFNGAPTAPVRLYSDLTLKAITGTTGRRFALLNNQTFAAGDTAKVKLENREVKVRCLEVREKSVVVAVEGQQGQREITLAGTQ
jgi:thioredoxin-related protein